MGLQFKIDLMVNFFSFFLPMWIVCFIKMSLSLLNELN